MRIRILTTVCLLVSTWVFAQKEEEKKPDVTDIAATISARDLEKHLVILASDSFGGRETGFEGQKMAAEYIENHFKEIGLSPGMGNGSYQQPFPIVVEKPGNCDLSLGNNDFKFMDDFFYLGSFPKQEIAANELVFAGYGIEENNWQDYKSLDVKDKVVVILSGEPKRKDGKYVLTDEDFPSKWTSDRFKKINLAQEKGAKSVIVLSDKYEKMINGYKRFIMRKRTRLVGKKREVLPYFFMSKESFLRTGKAQKKLLAKYEKGKKLKSRTIAFPVKIYIEPDVKEMTGENVLGFLEGGEKKDEIVVITAHYDHIGMTENKIFNGADDDGSGTVTVLELAEAFAFAKKNGLTPKRSILFMTVSGEEKGLLGSEHYTDHPVYPLENTVCDLNIDMVGRVDDAHEGNPDYIYLIGSDKLSTELHELSEKMNATYTKLELDYTYNEPDDPNRFYYRSDHYNFAKNNIPVIFYFNGVHEDYHKETDTVEKINFDKMEKIGKLIFHTAWEVANRDQKLEVDVENEFKNDR